MVNEAVLGIAVWADKRSVGVENPPGHGLICWVSLESFFQEEEDLVEAVLSFYWVPVVEVYWKEQNMFVFEGVEVVLRC